MKMWKLAMCSDHCEECSETVRH